MEEQDWVYLCGVSQEKEADVIVALLAQEGIPSFKKYPEAGGYLKVAYGLTAGVDLYVPGALREKALELVQEPLGTSPEEFDFEQPEFSKETEAEAEVDDPPSTSNSAYKIVLAGLLVGVVLILLARHF